VVIKPKSDHELASWLDEHTMGFVLKTTRTVDARCMVLHRATCAMVMPKRGIPPESATQGQYRKVCADQLSELQQWVTKTGRPYGSFSKRCGRCKP
jgi:hypothetical protein